MIRQDRNINGGGVALYVHSDYRITKLESSDTEGLGRPEIPEYLFCEVQQGSSAPILIGVIYRPPHIAMQKNTDLFEKRKKYSSDYSHKFIMEDLYADLSLAADAHTIRTLARNLNLKVVERGPTHRHTPNSYT